MEVYDLRESNGDKNTFPRMCTRILFALLSLKNSIPQNISVRLIVTALINWKFDLETGPNNGWIQSYV